MFESIFKFALTKVALICLGKSVESYMGRKSGRRATAETLDEECDFVAFVCFAGVEWQTALKRAFVWNSMLETSKDLLDGPDPHVLVWFFLSNRMCKTFAAGGLSQWMTWVEECLANRTVNTDPRNFQGSSILGNPQLRPAKPPASK